MTSPAPVCRWGILGTAGIARKNWLAIHHAGNARVVAVASRDVDRAAAFIDGCQASRPVARRPDAVGSYEALLARDDVDAVYLPLPTGIRTEWAVRAAEAGKHVVVEKPCGTTVADLERILAACRRHDVQFMDGVMFRHSRRLEAVRAVLGADESGIGPIRRIASQFTFRGPPEFFTGNIRMRSDLEPLGALGDLGWYPIAFAVWALWPRLPDAVTGRLLAAGGSAEGGGVPWEFAGELLWRSAPDVSASFFCSFLVEHQQWAHVSGPRGSVWIDDFVLPSLGSEVSFTVSRPRFVVEGCDFRMERHERRIAVEEYSHGHPSAQETNLFRHFSRLVLDGTRESMWPEAALAVQRVMMACLESSAAGGRERELEASSSRSGA
jgi:predicted dehydrogenase